MSRPIRVGVIGCGTISEIYMKNLARFADVELAACADAIDERAREKAAAHGIRAMRVADLLADPEIRIVLNLTVPKAHVEVALKVLEAGKSVYNEKPLTVTREDGMCITDIARARGLLVGCAPDTFLGAGLQTCRKLIDDGAIGRPVAAVAFMLSRGVETWHPNPEFYYKPGGGPMFDMGPYYLTALVNMLGPIRRVVGGAKISIPERTITSKPFAGQKINVEVPTHVTGILDFENGANATLITSFEVWRHSLPRIEIYGTDGSLAVPDPNSFGGPVRLFRQGGKEWEDVALTHAYAENSRGVGVADMAGALRNKRAHRAAGDMAFHVLDVMHAIHEAAADGGYVEIKSSCRRPEAFSAGQKDWEIDD